MAVVREAYVQGVSTRRIDDLVKALGLDGISRSQVSRLCEELDTEVERFRQRKLEGATRSYGWTLPSSKFDTSIGSYRWRLSFAIGVNADGQREVLGLDVGPSGTARSGTHFCAVWLPAA